MLVLQEFAFTNKEGAVDIKSGFSILSGALVVAGFVLYLVDTLKGKTTPRKSTWIIFLVLDGIAFAGMWMEHKLNGQIFASVVVAAFSMVLAFRYGKSGWTTRDKLCLGGAAGALLLWWLSGDAVVGIFVSMSVLVLGAIPMLIETWEDPGSEDRIAWLIYWLSCVAMLLGIREWTLAEASQPVAFTIIETTMVCITWFRWHKPARI